MHSNTHSTRSGKGLGKCVTYNQIRFELHPSPLKSFLHVKIYFIACLCNWPIISHGVPLLIGSCYFSDPYQSQITWGTQVVFSVGLCMFWSDMRTLETSFLTPRPQNGLLPRPASVQKTWDKQYTPRTQIRVSVKPIIHLLVANAMSVCNLVSTLFFCLEFTKGLVSDLTMSYFSEVWHWCVGGY